MPVLKTKISPVVAFPVILAVIGGFFVIDNRAAVAATDVKPTVWTNDKCLSCHTDAKTLKRMQDKAGDSSFCQAAYNQLTAAKSGVAAKGPAYKADNWK